MQSDFLPALAARLKKAAGNQHPSCPHLRDHRILIVRKSMRRIANQDEVTAALKSRGFVEYDLSGMTLAKQIDLFSRASAIVGVHGAGFANCIFAPPGCRVVEIMPQAEFRPNAWAISDAMSHDHRILEGSSTGFRSDINVDIDALLSLLDA